MLSKLLEICNYLLHITHCKKLHITHCKKLVTLLYYSAAKEVRYITHYFTFVTQQLAQSKFP